MQKDIAYYSRKARGRRVAESIEKSPDYVFYGSPWMDTTYHKVISEEDYEDLLAAESIGEMLMGLVKDALIFLAWIIIPILFVLFVKM